MRRLEVFLKFVKNVMPSRGAKFQPTSPMTMPMLRKPTSAPVGESTRLRLRGLLVVLPVVGLGLLTGCSTVKPKSLESAKMSEMGAEAREASRLGVEPINGPLTLEESIARAQIQPQPTRPPDRAVVGRESLEGRQVRHAARRARLRRLDPSRRGVDHA